MPIIIVHGNFTVWSGWSNCSVTCGSGFKYRTRNCTNPAPENGGNNCNGEHTNTTDCSVGYCPGEFKYHKL